MEESATERDRVALPEHNNLVRPSALPALTERDRVALATLPERVRPSALPALSESLSIRFNPGSLVFDLPHTSL